jgi:hypothetical protein
LRSPRSRPARHRLRSPGLVFRHQPPPLPLPCAGPAAQGVQDFSQ